MPVADERALSMKALTSLYQLQNELATAVLLKNHGRVCCIRDKSVNAVCDALQLLEDFCV